MKHIPISRGRVLYVRVLGIILLPSISRCVYDFYVLFSLLRTCAFKFLKIYFSRSLFFDFVWLYMWMYLCSNRRNSLTVFIYSKYPNWLLIYFAVLIILVRSHIFFYVMWTWYICSLFVHYLRLRREDNDAVDGIQIYCLVAEELLSVNYCSFIISTFIFVYLQIKFW